MATALALLSIVLLALAVGGWLEQRYPRVFDRAAHIVFGGAVDDHYVP